MSKRPGDPGYAAEWCIHYRFNRDAEKPEDDTCEAGVQYSTLGRPRPCFLDEGQSRPDAAPCTLLRRPTPEEIALHEKWVEYRRGLLGTVMKGIRPWREAHKGRSAFEVVECPACTGRLHLSISAHNGRVHGRCETADCVLWME
jgi:hypothetical protein